MDWRIDIMLYVGVFATFVLAGIVVFALLVMIVDFFDNLGQKNSWRDERSNLFSGYEAVVRELQYIKDDQNRQDTKIEKLERAIAVANTLKEHKV